MQAPSRLAPVEFALRVEHRGLVAFIAFPNPRRAPFRVGKPVVFVRPDGKAFCTTVQGLEVIEGGRSVGLLGLLLPHEVQKEDIPRGTMVRIPEVTGQINL
jgi:hypothetical protein